MANCGGVAYVDVFDTRRPRPRLLPAGLGLPAVLGDERQEHRRGRSPRGRPQPRPQPRRRRRRDGLLRGPRRRGRRSWASATTGRSASGARATTPTRTTPQDDLAVIASRAESLRADEAGRHAAAAERPAERYGVHHHRGRRGLRARRVLGGGGVAGRGARRAEPEPRHRAERRSTSDGDRGHGQPAVAGSARRSVATGMGLDANIDLDRARGSYVVAVDGVGRGTPIASYDDYGSLGGYTLGVFGDAGRTVRRHRPPRSCPPLTGDGGLGDRGMGGTSEERRRRHHELRRHRTGDAPVHRLRATETDVHIADDEERVARSRLQRSTTKAITALSRSCLCRRRSYLPSTPGAVRGGSTAS